MNQDSEESKLLQGISERSTNQIVSSKILNQLATNYVYDKDGREVNLQDQIRELAKTITREELARKNKDIVVVSCSKPEGIENFCKWTGFWSDRMFVDPNLKVYKAMGLTRAKNFSQLKGKGIPNKDSKTGLIAGFCWSIWNTIRLGKQGDVYQLGGSFLIGPGSKILWQYVDESSQDHITAAKVRELLDL